MTSTRSSLSLASSKKSSSSLCGRTDSRSPLLTRHINPSRPLLPMLGSMRRPTLTRLNLPLATNLQRNPNGGLAGSFLPKNRLPQRMRILRRVLQNISPVACGISPLSTTDWAAHCPSVGFSTARLVPPADGRPVFIGSGINILLQEFILDPTYNRFGLLATSPFLVCVSLVSGPFRTRLPLLISISFSVCKSLPTSRIGELS